MKALSVGMTSILLVLTSTASIAQVVPLGPPVPLPQDHIAGGAATYLESGELALVLRDAVSDRVLYHRYSAGGELLSGPVDLGLFLTDRSTALLPLTGQESLLVSDQNADREVLLRRLGPDGELLGPPVRADHPPGGFDSHAVRGRDGGWVVRWIEFGTVPDRLWVRFYRPDGTPYGDPVDSGIVHVASPGALAALPGGGFLVAWTTPDADGRRHLFRRFAADGTPLDPTPRPAVLNWGRFVASRNGFWEVSNMGNDDNFETFIAVQRYGPDGEPVGEPSEFLHLDSEFFRNIARGAAPTAEDGLAVFYNRHNMLCQPVLCREAAGIITLGSDGAPLGPPVVFGGQAEMLASDSTPPGLVAVTDGLDEAFLHFLGDPSIFVFSDGFESGDTSAWGPVP